MARKKKSQNAWDKWAFNLAWILAVVLALGGALSGRWVTMPFWTLILVILGLVVGFMYKLKDVPLLILVTLALALFGGSSYNVIPYVGPFVDNAIAYFVAFLTPATVLVALRKGYEILK
jgi:hypothetical protein